MNCGFPAHKHNLKMALQTDTQRNFLKNQNALIIMCIMHMDCYTRMHNYHWVPVLQLKPWCYLLAMVLEKKFNKKSNDHKHLSPPLLMCTLYMLTPHQVVIIIFIVALTTGTTLSSIVLIWWHIHFLHIFWKLLYRWTSSQECFQFLKIKCCCTPCYSIYLIWCLFLRSTMMGWPWHASLHTYLFACSNYLIFLSLTYSSTPSSHFTGGCHLALT